MADPIVGTLEIQTDPDAQTRIVLDPAKAEVTAGGNGQTGNVVIHGAGGTEVARLGLVREIKSDPNQPTPMVVATYVGLRIRTTSGTDVVRLGRIGQGTVVNPPDEVELVLGGTGFSGGIRLIDKSGKTRFTLGQVLGKDGCFVIHGPNGGRLLEFDPESAALYVGAQGKEGDLILKDGGGKESVKLDGGNRSLRLGTPEQPRTRLTEGNAWLGGHGSDGDVVLFAGDGDNQTLGQATVHLDGGTGRMAAGGAGVNGEIRLNAADDRRRIRMEAAGGNLWLGGNGVDGDLVLFRDTGDNQTLEQASIHLNGGAGDIVLRNADCAEEFDLGGDPPEPGTVMVIDDAGRLRESRGAYDKRVAGVVSGAGNFAPGIVLDRRETTDPRVRVALAGKVWCKAQGPIEPGDLLTTSDTAGRAMRASDPARAFGTVIGKALGALGSGPGLVPALVTLQ